MGGTAVWGLLGIWEPIRSLQQTLKSLNPSLLALLLLYVLLILFLSSLMLSCIINACVQAVFAFVAQITVEIRLAVHITALLL